MRPLLIALVTASCGRINFEPLGDAGVRMPRAYIKASNTDPGDSFGSVALSGDGNTLAVGALFESSSSIDQLDNNAPAAGAVYGAQTSNAAPASGAVYVFQ